MLSGRTGTLEAPVPVARADPEPRLALRREELTVLEFQLAGVASAGDAFVAFAYSPTGQLYAYRARRPPRGRPVAPSSRRTCCWKRTKGRCGYRCRRCRTEPLPPLGSSVLEATPSGAMRSRVDLEHERVERKAVVAMVDEQLGLVEARLVEAAARRLARPSPRLGSVPPVTDHATCRPGGLATARSVTRQPFAPRDEDRGAWLSCERQTPSGSRRWLSPPSKVIVNPRWKAQADRVAGEGAVENEEDAGRRGRGGQQLDQTTTTRQSPSRTSLTLAPSTTLTRGFGDARGLLSHVFRRARTGALRLRRR